MHEKLIGKPCCARPSRRRLTPKNAPSTHENMESRSCSSAGTSVSAALRGASSAGAAASSAWRAAALRFFGSFGCASSATRPAITPSRSAVLHLSEAKDPYTPRSETKGGFQDGGRWGRQGQLNSRKGTNPILMLPNICTINSQMFEYIHLVYPGQRCLTQ